MKTTKLTLLLCLCVWLTEAFAQNTISISAEKDNTLYEDPSGNLSNGIGDVMTIGRTTDGEMCRGLLAFDIANNIPVGAVVTRVELQVNVASAANSGARTISLHKLNQNWGEGESDATNSPSQGAQATNNDATWINSFYGSEDWDIPGGDYQLSSSSSQSINSTGRYALPNSDLLIADVQAWLDNPMSNFGWILLGDESEFETTKFISTRETARPVNRPTLLVTYSLVSEIEPIADNTMYSESDMLSNGGGDFLFVGNSPDGMSRRALIKFDLTNSIPDNAVIRDAELCLHVSKGARIESNISMHRSIANWGESEANAGGDEEGGAPSGNGDATWRFNSFNVNMAMATEWDNMGGDFMAPSSAATAVKGPSNYSWNSIQLLSDVQEWINTPESNFGWIMIGDESQANTSARFISKDLNGSSAGPKLKVTYDLPTLPVVMEKFQAMPKSCKVDLSWVTHLELNNSGFYIERSNDLQNWEMIKEIKGSMNSAEMIYYTFTDESPNDGINYYKVKQLDSDGSVKYTQILSAQASLLDCQDRTVSFFPNPTQDALHFKMTGYDQMMKRQMNIYNSIGQKMKTIMISKDQTTVDITDLRSGMYFVTVEGLDSFTFIKE